MAALPGMDIRTEDYAVARMQAEAAAEMVRNKEPVLRDVFNKAAIATVESEDRSDRFDR